MNSCPPDDLYWGPTTTLRGSSAALSRGPATPRTMHAKATRPARRAGPLPMMGIIPLPSVSPWHGNEPAVPALKGPYVSRAAPRFQRTEPRGGSFPSRLLRTAEVTVDRDERAGAPLVEAPADLDERRAEVPQRGREEAVDLLAPIPAVTRRIGDPRDVGREQQVELRAPFPGRALHPLRAGPVVVPAVHDRAHEVGVVDDEALRVARRFVLPRHLSPRDRLHVGEGEGTSFRLHVLPGVLGGPRRGEPRRDLACERRLPRALRAR